MNRSTKQRGPKKPFLKYWGYSLNLQPLEKMLMVEAVYNKSFNCAYGTE